MGKSRGNNCHWKGRVLRSSQSSEFELMASISIWTGSISISIFLIDILSKTENLILEIFFLLNRLSINYCANCRTQVSRYNSRRSFMSSESYLVSRRSNSSKIEFIVSFYRHQVEENEEPEQLFIFFQSWH
jgi:hypothetical protein